MEKTNTDARKAAVEFLKKKLEFPALYIESDLLCESIGKVTDIILEFAQSRHATLKKVSDEEIKKFANDFDEGYSEKHGTDCTRSGFIAGVKWRESISEETKIRFNYVSDWVDAEIYSIENNLKNADNGTYAFDIFSDKLEQFKRLKSVISLFEQPEAKP